MDTTDPPPDAPTPDEVPILGAGLKLDDPNGPLAPYYASNTGIVIALLLTVAGVIYAYQPLWNTDIWGHVAYGRHIVTKGLPQTEPLSPFTDHQQQFGPYSWLAQSGYYGLVYVGQKLHPNNELAGIQAGAELIRFVHWLAQMGTFVFLWLACRRRAGPIAANVAIVLLLLSIPTMLGIQRPQAFGAFFFAIMLWQWSGPTPSGRSLWWNIAIVLLFGLWANIHGSFAVALVFQGLHLLGTSLQTLREKRDVTAVLRSNEFRTASIVLVACFLATFVNPRGVLLYKDMLALSSHPNVRSMVEWQGIEARQTGLWIASLASAGIVLGCQLIARRFDFVNVLLFVVFLAWGFSQQRMMLWWFLLYPWLACAYFTDIVRKCGFTPSTTPPELNFRKTFIAVGFVAIGMMFTPWVDLVQTRLKQAPERTFASGTCWALAMELNAEGAQRGQYLPELAKVLRTYPDGHLKGPIFATETQGDFLLFTQPADRPTMMFSHAHSFNVDYWNRCLEVKAGDPHWAYTLRKYKVNLVVAEPMFNLGLTNLLKNDPEWAIVLDEEGNEKISDERGRKVIAVRKKPIAE